MTLISMSFIDSALEECNETLLTLRTRLDAVLDQDEGALASAVLATYGRVQHAIAHHGTFDLSTREAIALAVAAVQDCPDCRFTRTVACHAAGWTRAQTNALRSGERIVGEEQITALLAVARQAAGPGCQVDQNTWQQALWTGWTIEELAELFTHVIANVFTHCFTHHVRAEAGIFAVPGPAAAVA